jgi:hypothetical protein
MGILIQEVWLSVPGAEVRDAVFSGSTVIVPPVETVPQPPVSSIRYVYTPALAGVPLIVTISAAQATVIPAGSPVKFAPVAEVVV